MLRQPIFWQYFDWHLKHYVQCAVLAWGHELNVNFSLVWKIWATLQHSPKHHEFLSRRKVWKSGGGGARSNVVGIICLHLGWDRVNWSAKTGEAGDPPPGPPPPSAPTAQQSLSRPRWLKSGEICGCQVSYKPSWLGWSLKTRSMIVSDKRQLAAANDRQGIPWNFSQR